MIQQLKHGEILLADLNPRNGTELGKRRPVLIIQEQVLLDIKHPSTLIIPLTTQLRNGAEPLRIRIKAQQKLERDSDLLIDQIRAIDNERLIDSVIATCDKTLLQKVYKALVEVLGIRLVEG
jgi:mRNA interferase MazF